MAAPGKQRVYFDKLNRRAIIAPHGACLKQGEEGEGVSEKAVLYTAQEILETYGDMILRTAYAMVKNRADAEDILQDVFLSLVRTKPVFESAEHQKAWLLRVTMNRCKSFLRSAWQQRTQGLDEAFPDMEFTPEETGVAEAMAGLPLKYRQVLYLYYVEGYTAGEIGKLLKRPQGTVLSQMARGRKMLKEKLEGGRILVP